jgi:hypothetical protein
MGVRANRLRVMRDAIGRAGEWSVGRDGSSGDVARRCAVRGPGAGLVRT